MPEDPDRETLDDLDLDLDADLAHAEQRLSVRVETRRYGKPVTIVEGFESGAVDLADVASTLKRRLGVGGTVDGGAIELQGDNAERVPGLLRELGFAVKE